MSWKSNVLPHAIGKHLGTFLIAITGSLAPLSLFGCANPLTAASGSSPLTLSVSNSSIPVGDNTTLIAMRAGVPVDDGTWEVIGGQVNGTITPTGTYQAPTTMPTPNTVTISYTESNSTQTTSVSVVNPAPMITAVSPAILSPGLSTTLIVSGTGFVGQSMIVVNATPVATTHVDATHLAAVIQPVPGASSLQVAVVSPSPGGGTSPPATVAENSVEFTVSPSVLTGGQVSVTVSGSKLPPNAVVVLAGKPMTTQSSTPSSITATGFLPPWLSGNVTVGIAADASSSPLGVQTVPIAPTPVSFDVAARFSTQAAFGPRPDIVSHIQHVGLDAFITEQLNLPGVTYQPTGLQPRTQYLIAIQTGSSLLRLRLALAFQSFIPGSGIFVTSSTIPYEELLERDSTTNFRTLLTDIAGDENLTHFLNLADNDVFAWAPGPPNQNFAREIMQLFTLGPNLLNDNGTLQLDPTGNPIPTYTQEQVVDLSRALTGWSTAPNVQPLYSAFGIDYSQPLVVFPGGHDWGAKTIVGGVSLPAGESVEDDRTKSLDAIFQHPNLPPFVSRLLIQRLVKSAPSPQYVERVAKVFENDGMGTRGNLSAVVRAILLDPEARVGDTSPQVDDGFLQEPLLQQIFTTSVTQQPIWDDEPVYYGNSVGETWWLSPTVFGFYSPSGLIPGTGINSPEFALLNNITATVRSELVWGMLTGTIPGYGPPNFGNSSWLYSNFATVPDLMDAIDHLAFHGRMQPEDKAAIVLYCAGIPQQDRNSQFTTALFLALSGDPFVVVH